jgi:hypothetical protein
LTSPSIYVGAFAASSNWSQEKRQVATVIESPETADAALSVERLLTEPQASKVCDVPPSVLQRLRRTGGGPKFIVIGKTTIRYRPSALRAWLAEREVSSMAEFYAGNAERALTAAKQRRSVAHARETRHPKPAKTARRSRKRVAAESAETSAVS